MKKKILFCLISSLILLFFLNTVAIAAPLFEYNDQSRINMGYEYSSLKTKFKLEGVGDSDFGTTKNNIFYIEGKLNKDIILGLQTDSINEKEDKQNLGKAKLKTTDLYLQYQITPTVNDSIGTRAIIGYKNYSPTLTDYNTGIETGLDNQKEFYLGAGFYQKSSDNKFAGYSTVKYMTKSKSTDVVLGFTYNLSSNISLDVNYTSLNDKIAESTTGDNTDLKAEMQGVGFGLNFKF